MPTCCRLAGEHDGHISDGSPPGRSRRQLVLHPAALSRLPTCLPCHPCLPALPQERRKAAGEGLRFRRLRGGEVSEAQWDAFYDFYLNTTGAR